MADSSKLPLATCTGQITVIKNGEKGEQGATERFRKYDDIPAYDSIQCGGNGDKYIDYVVYGSDWYLCIKNHAKDSRNYPPQNTTYWQKVSEQKRIATTLLLATKSYINNLMVNDILVTSDGSATGDKLLVANKDGITCNQGTFKNVTVAGTINAANGKIGSFDIKTYTDSTNFKFYGLYAHTDGTIAIPASTSQLDYTGLYVGSGLAALGGSVRIGWNGSQDGSEFSWSNGLVYASGNFGNSTKAGEQTAFYADMAGNNKNTVVGFEASAYNGQNNYAFWARQGDFVSQAGLFRGLRPNIQTTDRSVTLTDMDNVIICTNSGDITLTFPSSPKKGQMYIVIQTGGNIYFNGNGKTFRGRLSGDTVNSKTGGQITFFFWNGSYWSCSYAN